MLNNIRPVLAKLRGLGRIPVVGPIARSCFSKLRSHWYGKVVTRRIDGVNYELDLSEGIDSSLFFFGHYEIETSETLRRFIRSEMTVFEIGANIGAHTFEIAKLLDPDSGRLYSFEPTEYAFAKLQRNFELNEFENIVIEKMALSNTNEQKDIHRGESVETSPFKASWDTQSRNRRTKSVDRITFMRLDDYCIEHRVEKVDLIKVDVDGYELRVIDGAKETIRKHQPILIMELGVTVERIGDTVEALIGAIHDLDYSIHSIDTGAVVDADAAVELIRRQNVMDYLCLSNARAA